MSDQWTVGWHENDKCCFKTLTGISRSYNPGERGDVPSGKVWVIFDPEGKTDANMRWNGRMGSGKKYADQIVQEFRERTSEKSASATGGGRELWWVYYHAHDKVHKLSLPGPLPRRYDAGKQGDIPEGKAWVLFDPSGWIASRWNGQMGHCEGLVDNTVIPQAVEDGNATDFEQYATPVPSSASEWPLWAEFAQSAYGRKDDRHSAATALVEGWEYCKLSDHYCVWVQNESGSVAFCCRGTKPTDPNDVAVDINIGVQQSGGTSDTIFRGRVRETIEHYNAAIQDLQEKGFDIKRVIATGHSLGGALAYHLTHLSRDGYHSQHGDEMPKAIHPVNQAIIFNSATGTMRFYPEKVSGENIADMCTHLRITGDAVSPDAHPDRVRTFCHYDDADGGADRIKTVASSGALGAIAKQKLKDHSITGFIINGDGTGLLEGDFAAKFEMDRYTGPGKTAGKQAEVRNVAGKVLSAASG